LPDEECTNQLADGPEAVIPCTLCEELAGKADPYLGRAYGTLIESGDNLLLDAGGFAVLPSVGALNASHALVVPKEHVCSFAMLPRERLSVELPPILLALREVNASAGAAPVFFEHGMGSVVDTSGACVAHAHLHAVADAHGFEQSLRRDIRFVNIPALALIKDLASKEEGYVAFESATGEAGLANRPNLPSQFFRKVYAAAAGAPEIWNWRMDAQPKNTRRVTEYYRPLRAAYEAAMARAAAPK
jgi:hypothetical protein